MTNPQALLAEQAAEVVGKLTARMSAALQHAFRNDQDNGRLWAFCRRGTMLALMNRGLVDGGKGYPPRVAPLSDLGLACRAILIERQGK